MAIKPRDNRLDMGKLQAMVEPITVRVMKIKANTKQPVPIPGRDGGAPGTGLTREDILKLESFILEWSGGGHYEAEITDSANMTLQWMFGWDPRLHPERIPPTDMSSASFAAVSYGIAQAQAPTAAIPSLTGMPPPAPAPIPPPNGYGSPMPANVQPFGAGSYAGGQWPPPPAAYVTNYPQPQPQPPPQPPPQTAWRPTPVESTPFGPWNNFSDPRRGFDYSRFDRDYDRDRGRDRDRDHERIEAENRARALEEQIRRADLEKKEIEHRASLERQEQQHLAAQAAMRDEMRRIAEAKNTSESEETRRAREETARLERQREQDRLDLRFKELQEAQMRAQENMMRMFEKLQEKKPDEESTKMREIERRMEAERYERERQAERDRFERAQEKERFERERERERFEQQLVKLQESMANARPDPMIEVMKENARAQAEAARENARASELAQAKMANFMVNPIEMLRMAKESSTGAEAMMNNIITAFGGVFNTYKGAMESILQIQGNGSPNPFVGILQQGLSDGKDMFEQWMHTKRDATVAAEKTRQMEAQRDAITAQSNAQRWAPPPPVQPVPPGQAPAPVNGQSTNGNGQNVPTGQNGQQAAPPAQAEVVPNDIDPAKLPKNITVQDLKVFMYAPMIRAVSNLRTGVNEFIKAKGQPGPDGKPVGLDPDTAVHAILRGIMMAEQAVAQGVIPELPPAFKLFAERRFPDMIDLLMPKAPMQYREMCVQIIAQKVKGDHVEDPVDPEDPEMIEDDEEEEMEAAR